jgi:hypothetical protein
VGINGSLLVIIGLTAMAVLYALRKKDGKLEAKNR